MDGLTCLSNSYPMLLRRSTTPWRNILQRYVFSYLNQSRMASILSELRPIPGSTVNSTRVGRGPGNKTGKTAGRGTKGQNARSGGKNPHYEGGQTPIHIRFPKIGDKSSRRLRMTPVNLDRIQEAIDDGRIDPKFPITMDILKRANIINKVGDGVKLLARGKDILSQPITIYVSRASKEAIQHVEEKGGQITTVYYNHLGLQYLMNPDKFGVTRRAPRAALPVRRYLIDYYSNPLKRGYLSSPAVDLSELGLAPPKNKTISPLPTIPISEVVARSHAVLMYEGHKAKLLNELKEAKAKYKELLALTQKSPDVDSKGPMPEPSQVEQ